MFLSATLHSYTGVWGQDPLVCSQSSWPQQKTPYCLHWLSTRVFIWEPQELGGTGDWTDCRDAPSLPRCCFCSRLGKTRMDDSFKGKKKKQRERRREKQKVPPSMPPHQKGYSLDQKRKEQEGRGAEQEETWSIRASDGWRRISCNRHGFNPEFIPGCGPLPDSLWFELKLRLFRFSFLGFFHNLMSQNLSVLVQFYIL